MAIHADEQYPLPMEVEKIFEDAGALELHEVSEYFKLDPKRLVMYGLGVLLALKQESEKTGIEHEICLRARDGSHRIWLDSPAEAAETGQI